MIVIIYPLCSQLNVFEDYSGVWLGLTQSDYGNYTWMDEEQFNYTNYVAYLPFYYGSDCFMMNAANGYRWADDFCDRSNHFICEKEGMSIALGIEVTWSSGLIT